MLGDIVDDEGGGRGGGRGEGYTLPERGSLLAMRGLGVAIFSNISLQKDFAGLCCQSLTVLG